MPDEVPANQVLASRIAKLPAFWKDDVELWLTQVEAAFGIAQITQDQTKFQYLVANADPAILPHIADIIKLPPAQEKYEALKSRILTVFAEAEESKLRRLLKGTALNDQRPSHLLQVMKNTAGNQCNDNIIKSLFLEQMPDQVRAILVANSEQNIDKLAILADKLVDLQRPNQVYAVRREEFVSQPSSMEASIIALTQQVKDLTSTVKQIQSRSRSHSRNRTYLQKRGNNNNNTYRDTNQAANMCYFHKRFKAAARNCKAPCSWDTKTNAPEN